MTTKAIVWRLFALAALLLALAACQPLRVVQGGMAEQGSISGVVTPAEAGIRVQAIQNLSIAAEAMTDELGNYKIDGLEPGNYGLLFTRDNIVYIYNDATNPNPEEGAVDESLALSGDYGLSGHNLNLDEETGDYVDGRVIVTFTGDTLISEVWSFNTTYNVSLLVKSSPPGFKTPKTLVLGIPGTKTVLEMVALFRQDSRINISRPFLALYYIAPREVEMTDEIERCMVEKEPLYEGVKGAIYEGDLILSLQDKEMMIEEPIALIESYNLSFRRLSFPEYFSIKVPKGEEKLWLCVLGQEHIVSEVQFSLISREA